MLDQSTSQSTTGDDRAMSNVVGAILLIAVTVIVAGVIGFFVLGQSSTVQGNTAPSTQFKFIGSPGENYTIQVQAGDSFDPQNVDIVYHNKSGSTVRLDWEDQFSDDVVETGDTLDLSDYQSTFGTSNYGGQWSEDRIQIVWTSSQQSAQTLAEFKVPLS